MDLHKLHQKNEIYHTNAAAIDLAINRNYKSMQQLYRGPDSKVHGICPTCKVVYKLKEWSKPPPLVNPSYKSMAAAAIDLYAESAFVVHWH